MNHILLTYRAIYCCIKLLFISAEVPWELLNVLTVDLDKKYIINFPMYSVLPPHDPSLIIWHQRHFITVPHLQICSTLLGLIIAIYLDIIFNFPWSYHHSTIGVLYCQIQCEGAHHPAVNIISISEELVEFNSIYQSLFLSSMRLMR